MDEANTLGGRLARYAKVGGTGIGLAARFAGARLTGGGDAATTAAQLRVALGGLKGPVMKIAQILSTIPGAVPDDFAKELGQLQADAPAMGWPFVRRRMKAELGADWESRYASFEHEAAAAASLGQVHRAVAHDGRALAAKLQYPDMASAVEADLGQLDVLFGIYRQFDKSIDTGQIRGELADRLREELDYEREAKHLALYRDMLSSQPAVHLPEVLPDLSTKRLLTMTWLPGKPLLGFKGDSLEVRNCIAETMFRAWYWPLHHYGVIHGDPHLGNYAVREEPDGQHGINLLDFGCIRVFPPRFIKGVVDLFHAIESNDKALAVDAFERWGFVGLSTEIIDTLLIWATFLYGPLLDDRVRRIDDQGRPADYGRETAQKVHRRLKELGTVTIPSEFVFMDRAAIGLGGVFMHLAAELNWRRLFGEMIEGFTEDGLAARQSAALARAGLEPPVAPTLIA
ncbi:ABC1 kinase family protein [Glacieibacterium megasporae]|uniref:ABC1 kinase family protein n=1 Tax=Glacieibacterium megasporae TaxID=2835787 RepID=UPI001C1E78BB|nr:AarF/ABC1/UbiB kinase family protein [Polymorphobacter megasporae]UAJ10278.1 AarF/ABC1/UbiB kinase family protein [Polymorphobacter megasporae]